MATNDFNLDACFLVKTSATFLKAVSGPPAP
jgi:hypothetical protein